MIKKFDIYNSDLEITIEITSNKKNKVIEAILDFMIEHNCAHGEKLCQDDDCQIEAPQLLANIIDDILKPEIQRYR